MISGIGNQNYAVEQVQPKTLSQIEKTSTEEQGHSSNKFDARENAISFVQTASKEEMKEKVDSMIGRMPSTHAMFDLRVLLSRSDGKEILDRIGRLGEKIESEGREVWKKEQDIISQGRANGKSDQDILIDIINMQDEQSDLYKMARRWGESALSSPENYEKIRKLTPSYVNTYA